MDYTKGEWTYTIDEDTITIYVPTHGTIAKIHKRWSWNDGSHGANARLITAAPEMYEALRKVRANIGHIIMTKADAILVTQIDEALAKAEGK